MRATCLAHLILLDSIILTIFGKEYKWCCRVFYNMARGWYINVETRRQEYYFVVKVSRSRHEGAKGERTYNSYSCLTSALEGVSDQRHASTVLYPRGKNSRYPIQEAGWASQLVWTQRLEEKSFCLCRGSNPRRPVCIQTLTELRNPN
jgi:hypothetical protein